MKIAYVVGEGLDKEHGVSKKIYNQIEYWTSKGHEVKLFYFSNKPLNSMFNKIEHEIINYKNRIHFVLNNIGIKTIEKWQPEIIYFRFYLFSRTFYSMLKKFPTVLEVNTDDIEESKIHMPYLARKFHLLTRELLMKNVSGFVCVTDELKRKFDKYKNPIETIPNGITPPFIGRNNGIKDSEKRKQIIFLGSPNQSWHGIDKIHQLAKKLPNFDFHVVGTNEIDNPVVNLKQYGFLNENEYLKIINKSDVAIGTLALHRKGMNEACPLKTREYLKYGIPTIIGYKDSDFSDHKTAFLLKLQNEEDNINNSLSDIKLFIENSREIKISNNDVKHIFNDYKENKRLYFMSSLI